MSGIEVERCEMQKHAKYPESAMSIVKDEKNSNNVASDILNNLVESAVDSAVKKRENVFERFSLVGDIADEFTPRSTQINDFPDIVDFKNQKQFLSATEEEVKKLIGQIANQPPKGTGDQLDEKEEVIEKGQTLPACAKACSLERKSRFTDLVKNSKSVISKFLSSENTKPKSNEWEENTEEFVKSIELNSLTHDSKAEEGVSSILTSDLEEKMENINLNDLEECLPDLDNEVDTSEYAQKSMTFPIGSSSGIPSSTPGTNENVKDKKKWNIGSKIVNYIKKKASRKDITKTDT